MELTIGIAIVVIVSAVLTLKSFGPWPQRPAPKRAEAAKLVVDQGPAQAAPARPHAAAPADAVATPAAPAPAQTPKSPKPPELASTWHQHLAAGQALVGQGKLFDARPLLTRALLGAPEGRERGAVKALLDRINLELVFSPRPTPDSEMHVVKEGGSLWLLSQKYNVNPGLIKWANHKSRDSIRPGERLKMLRGAWGAVVQKSKFRMMVFYNNNFVREYPVGIGQYDRTPTGTFVIDTKTTEPTWYGPEGVFPFGHAKNILGTRWLGFKETTAFHGYGIHGCKDPSTIGKAVSNGCIRMHNKDVEDVFKMLRRGDKVMIVP